MSEYIPGVCNIGPQEINRRRQTGWIGLLTTLVLLVIFLRLDLSHWWRLLIFFPAMFSASGFLQAYFHFCAGFARKGIFNFDEIGKTQKINDEASNVKDRQKGNQIFMYSALIGSLCALVSVFV